MLLESRRGQHAEAGYGVIHTDCPARAWNHGLVIAVPIRNAPPRRFI